MPVAIVTGASLGLGLALATALAGRGWELVIDARGAVPLHTAEQGLAALTRVRAIPGDVAEPRHRLELASAAREAGGLDLLVNNASLLGPSPQPLLADYPVRDLRRVFEVDVLAPLALTQLVLPMLARSATGTIVNVSSDAAAVPYPGWGGYGAAKAALDHLTAVLSAEHAGSALRFYAFDPGDLRTAMHQAAYPGQDISDRPAPESVVPAWWRLLDGRPDSGRFRAADLGVASPR